MKHYTIRIDDYDENEIVDIPILSDIHVGSASFREDLFLKALQEIQELNAPYIIFNGDMIDAIIHQDRKRFNPKSIHPDFRDLYSIDDIIRKECDKFIEYIEPLAKLGKKFIFTEGNHESACRKHHGFSPYNYIIDRMRNISYSEDYIIDCEEAGFIRVMFGNQHYDMYIQHGSGGSGFTQGYPLNNVSNLAKPIDCDLYTIGHIHKMSADVIETEGFNGFNSKWVGSSGCFMSTRTEGFQNYASNFAKSNSSIGYLVYSIKGNKKESVLTPKRMMQ